MMGSNMEEANIRNLMELIIKGNGNLAKNQVMANYTTNKIYNFKDSLLEVSKMGSVNNTLKMATITKADTLTACLTAKVNIL